MTRKATPLLPASATDVPLEAGTTLGRLLARAFEHLAAVMPGLPQLGIAMVLLFVAVAASHALQAPASADEDAASVSMPDPEAGFHEVPF